MITKAPRGTQDWYGEKILLRRKVEEIARDLCNKYNINEIETPAFEHTELFLRGVGETTDVVQKEMYTFNDKANRSITLKPEGTAGTVRAYLEHSLYADTQPTKLYYFTQAFRYEKPQAGRYRQHHQFGVEFFGSEHPQAEVELILLLKDLLDKLNIKDAKLHINSIGCLTCRKEYNKVLVNYLEKNQDKFCNTCKERMIKNPLRVLDCKDQTCSQLVKEAPKTIDYLDEECKNHFKLLKNLLNNIGIEYVIDSNVVRGLDYYTKTVFEFINSEGFTLCGGGRYDNLIAELGGKPQPAVGFGMGIERILLLLEQNQSDLQIKKPVQVYLGILGDNAMTKAYQIVHYLRQAGIKTETDFLKRSVKAQMKYANKINAMYTIILGENEINNNKVKVKEMDTGQQTEVNLDNLIEYIKTKINN